MRHPIGALRDGLLADAENSAIGTSATKVSKQTFYEQFSSNEEAFIAAYEALSGRALTRAVAAFEAAPSWQEGIAAGIDALLAEIAAEPLYARVSFFELPAAGQTALDSAEKGLEALSCFLEPEAFGETTPRTPSPCEIDAITGGVWTAIHHEIVRNPTASLSHLGPALTELVLAPFGVLSRGGPITPES